MNSLLLQHREGPFVGIASVIIKSIHKMRLQYVGWFLCPLFRVFLSCSSHLFMQLVYFCHSHKRFSFLCVVCQMLGLSLVEAKSWRPLHHRIHPCCSGELLRSSRPRNGRRGSRSPMSSNTVAEPVSPTLARMRFPRLKFVSVKRCLVAIRPSTSPTCALVTSRSFMGCLAPMLCLLHST